MSEKEWEAREKSVKREFGKELNLEAARGRKPAVEAFWSTFDLKNKICLDVGAGHPVVPAILSSLHPSLRFDCVDFSPDFERGAKMAILALGGDMSRFRLVQADFFHIADLAADGTLEKRYDYLLLTETLHHALRKAKLLKTLTRVMDEGSLMILVEPVLPRIGRRAAYEQSAWAREAGYIEEPVSMDEYRAALREAKLDIVALEHESSRETAPHSWKRRLAPGLYHAYRRYFRPIYALTSFSFVCRLAP